MKIHELKITPEYFKDVKSGHKRFELRKDDREYQVGDLLILKEFDKDHYTGHKTRHKTIQYILRDVPEYGLNEGYCILGF